MAGTSATRAPGTRSASWWPLLAVCVGYFMVILDATAVNVALPSLGRDLGTGITGLQWVVDGYTLVFAGLLLSTGAIGDRRGPNRVYQAGLLVFTAASVGCGLAPGTGWLVAARLAQGLGAALLVPASLALLQVAYSEPTVRARAFGIWGGVGGVGAAAGPLIGGALIGAFGWRSVFFVNLPVGLAGVALAARHVPAPAGRPRRLDPAAQALGILALAALTGALIEAGSVGWSAPLVLVGFGTAVAAAIAFVAVEHRAEQPMLPPALFRSPTFSGANLVGVLINLGFYGQLFVASIYFQRVRGDSALTTGLLLLPELAMAVVASTASGWVMARTGPRRPMLTGLALGGAGLLGWLVAGPHTPYPALIVPLVATGFGMAFTMPAATAAVMGAAAAEFAGTVSGVINAARQVGGVIGVALLGTLIADQATFVAGMHAGLIVASLAFFVGCAVTYRMVVSGAPARTAAPASPPPVTDGTCRETAQEQ
ncbi:MAG TPA: MFS transporter [Micromonosporaceae bacterium]